MDLSEFAKLPDLDCVELEDAGWAVVCEDPAVPLTEEQARMIIVACAIMKSFGQDATKAPPDT